MFVVEGLLSGEQVRAIVAEMPDDEFADGNQTTVNATAQLKSNLEMRAGANRERLGKLVLQAIQANPTIQSTALPARCSFPKFSKYLPGMYFDFHTDAAIFNFGLPTALRTDLSCTIFLSEPSSYDGGELTVRSAGGMKQWKLPAGSALLYRTSDLHRVETVTRGVRMAAVLWLQSYVRDATQRDLIARLNTVCQSLTQRGTDKSEIDAISSSIHDLIRMWAG